MSQKSYNKTRKSYNNTKRIQKHCGMGIPSERSIGDVVADRQLTVVNQRRQPATSLVDNCQLSIGDDVADRPLGTRRWFKQLRWDPHVRRLE